MACPTCSNELRDGARFCAQCGNPVASSGRSQRRTLVRNILLGIIMVLLIVLVIQNVSSGATP
jgi:predicted nucleic acid-binding Zn ribbon protein